MIQNLIFIFLLSCHCHWAFRPRMKNDMTNSGNLLGNTRLLGESSTSISINKQTCNSCTTFQTLNRLRGGDSSDDEDDDEDDDEEKEKEDDTEEEQEDAQVEQDKQNYDDKDVPPSTTKVEKTLQGEDDEEEEEDDEDGEDEGEEGEEDEEEDEEEEQVNDDQKEDSDEDTQSSSKHVQSKETSFDEPFTLSPIQELTWTVGSMILFSKVNLKDPKIIQWTRFLFIGYILAVQLFLIYVRIQAKSINDTTPITVTNPVNSFLQSQMAGGNQDTSNNSNMVKSLANALLTTQTTIVEYDLSQAKSMNMSLLTPMLFLWVLHFKFGQVQPLLFQTLSGIKDLVMSPLFQVYVWKKHLKRPFQNTKIQSTQEGTEDEKDEKLNDSDMGKKNDDDDDNDNNDNNDNNDGNEEEEQDSDDDDDDDDDNKEEEEEDDDDYDEEGDEMEEEDQGQEK